MFRSTLGPGDDVEAWCTRCRMNLNHRIIAVVGDEIQRVNCLTCGSDHKYHLPKGTNDNEDSTGNRKGASPPSKRKTKAARSTAAKGEWSTFMSQMPEDLVPRSYRITDAYAATDYIEHPVFGTGRVLSVPGTQKIEVIFKEGRKILVCNKNTAK
jgi:hypothetical protein